MVVILIDRIAILGEKCGSVPDRISFSVEVLQMMNLHSKNAVATIDGLLNFIVDEFSTGSFVADTNQGDTGSSQRGINQFLDRVVALRLRLFPKRFILKA